MRSLARFLLLAILAAGGCSRFDRLLEGTDVFDGKIAVAVPSASVTVAQGKELSFSATVTRTSGELRDAVGITVDGAPAGVSAVVATPTTSGNLTTATVTLRASAGASVGNYVLTVRGNAGPSVNAATLLSLAVTRAPAFTLGVSSSALTIARGGIAPFSVRFTRTNLDAPIALALSGPGGITAMFGANPIAGDSTTGTIAVAPTTAPGTYTISLRATTEALADQIAELSVTVTDDPLQVIVPSRITTGQGSNVLVPVIVNRAAFSGSVSLSAEDLPPDVAATFDPSATTGTTSSMSLRVGPSTPPGTHAIRVRGLGTGAPDATASLELTVMPTSVALAISPGDLSVFQGGAAATATVRITRTNYPGPVEITADSTTTGLSITAQPPSPSDTATLSVAASGTAAPGQYTVTVRGTPPGFPSSASATATIIVTIRPAPPGGGNVVLDWSRCGAPDWVAYQDGTAAWTQAPVSSGVARFTISAARGGIAYVENASSVSVRFGLQSEFIAKPIDMCPAKAGTKSATGFASLGALVDQMSFRLGGASANATGGAAAFTLAGVQDGAHDLVGWGNLTPWGRRGLLRRDVNLPSGSSLGTLDPLGIESFVPATALLTLTAVAVGEQTSHATYYMTTDACTPNFLYQANNAQLIGVPSGIQRTNDYHMVEAIAISGTRQRAVRTTFRTLANRSVAFPPLPTVPVVNPIAGGNYKRLSAGVGIVPGVYNGSIVLRYNDGSSKTMSVSVTPAFLNLLGVVTFGMPDFSGVSGWRATYAVDVGASGTWVVSVDGATPGPTCSEGRTTYLATQTGRY